MFALGDPAGRLLGGDAALLPLMPVLHAGEWRFFDTRVQGRAMRAAAFGAACGGAPPQACTILVAESLGKRAAAEWAVLLASLGAATVLARSLMLPAMLAVRRGLRPLHVAAAEVRSRTPPRRPTSGCSPRSPRGRTTASTSPRRGSRAARRCCTSCSAT